MLNSGEDNYYLSDDDAVSGYVGFGSFKNSCWFLLGCIGLTVVLALLFNFPYNRLQVGRSRSNV